MIFLITGYQYEYVHVALYYQLYHITFWRFCHEIIEKLRLSCINYFFVCWDLKCMCNDFS